MIYSFEGSFKPIYVTVYSIICWKHEILCLIKVVVSKYDIILFSIVKSNLIHPIIMDLLIKNLCIREYYL